MKTRLTALMFSMGLALPYAMSAAHPVQAQGAVHRQADVDALLTADRAFAAAAESQAAPVALGAMFGPDVIFTTEEGKLFRGKQAVVAAIAADPALSGANVTWQPVRGGISADGQHGFSFGFMTARAVDGGEFQLKYLAYWIRRPEGWRIAGYKYVRRPDGDVPTGIMAPLLPNHAISVEPASSDHHAESLVAAEKGFSDEAQTIGLAAAFARHGGPDSMNMGRKAAFTIGSENIARELFGAPRPGSPIQWSSDGVLVASSGDLGLSWGAIRLKSANPPQAIAFFTIWRRDGPNEPWRYIAE